MRCMAMGVEANVRDIGMAVCLVANAEARDNVLRDCMLMSCCQVELVVV